jgi:hypothetical protein
MENSMTSLCDTKSSPDGASAWRRWLPIAVALPLLAGAPLLGAKLAGKQLAPYLQFPPVTERVTAAPFNMLLFIALASVILLVVGPVIHNIIRSARRHRATPAVATFPWWGWAGLLLCLTAWAAAWAGVPASTIWQRLLFTPLWIGYIIVVNALLHRRTGSSLLTARPCALLAAAGVSALFWWYFEFLNRFVLNWHYVNLGTPTAGEYTLLATLPFATVLPAVWSTRELLGSYDHLWKELRHGRPLRVHRPRLLGAVLLPVAILSLGAISLVPDLLYPLVWVSPLLVIAAFNNILGASPLLAPLRRGDWSQVVTYAAAALVCGFFWEFWNWQSVVKWVYQVPYVGRYHLFEMPLLGYAGYLPFGLECAQLIHAISAKRGNQHEH